MTVDDVLGLAPVVPVLVVDDASHGEPLARALVAGGTPALEVTLRTPAALAVIAAMAQVPGAVVGAGTVLDEGQLHAAIDAGARFVVSPGFAPALARAAAARGVPLLPGAATATEIMTALAAGFTRLKFFPATAAGGLPALRALAAPFGQVRFCPTGGIGPDTAAAWLAEPQVLAVGGSWLARRGETDWAAISARAAAAAMLART
jgi:2-dehydro-3-deoxyphosphogluconate aldolase/(4S)-4-hydroxy-2-oxoglutarate aldolase